jgi:hypothetical protein
MVIRGGSEPPASIGASQRRVCRRVAGAAFDNHQRPAACQRVLIVCRPLYLAAFTSWKCGSLSPRRMRPSRAGTAWSMVVPNRRGCYTQPSERQRPRAHRQRCALRMDDRRPRMHGIGAITRRTSFLVASMIAWPLCG